MTLKDKMTCEDVRRRLSAFQDGELAADLESRVAAHLEECGGCRQESAALQEVTEQILRLPEVEPAHNFTAAVMTRLKERKRQRSRLFALPSFVYSSVFILVFGLGLWLNLPVKGGDEPAARQDSLSRVLYQSQNLSLTTVQEISLEHILAETRGQQ